MEKIKEEEQLKLKVSTNQDINTSSIDTHQKVTEKSPSNYILQDKIGSGGFGKVFKVKEKETGKIYAIKISLKSLDEESEDQLRDLSREINILSKLNHPSVLKFIGYSSINFKKKPKPMIITEYASNGTLRELIYSTENFDTKTTSKETLNLIIIYGIASAMSYLHKHNIIHRDLKPENVLLDDFFFPKIADFGLSKINDKEKQDDMFESKIGVIKGTPIYISPEIWEKVEYTKACDVYAFGFIIYEIVTKERPFKNFNIFQLPLNVKNGYRPEMPKNLHQSYKSLIEKCWSQDPLKRPTFDEILKILKEDKGFITKLVSKEDYFKYIKYVDEYESSFDSSKESIKINEYFIPKTIKPKSYVDKNFPISKICPFKELNQLSNKVKKTVIEGESDGQKQFIIGQSLIEGRNHFPLNIQLGIKYLKNAYQNGCFDSILYYCEILLKGKIVPQNLKKVEKLAEKYLKNKGEFYYLMHGKIMKKEKNYEEAKNFFEKSTKVSNSESMYEIGKMILDGVISPSTDENEAIEYLQKAADKGCLKAMYKYGLILKNQHGVDYIKKAADGGYLKAIYEYSLILEKNCQKDESIIYLKNAANRGHIESIQKYSSYLLDNNPNFFEGREALLYMKTASDKGHIDSMFKYGLLLFKGIGCIGNKKEASKYIRIAAENNNIDALNEYAKMLFTGDGVTSDKEKSIMHYKLAIEKGSTNAMNDYALILANDDSSNKEEMIELFKTAIERGNDDALINYAEMLSKGNVIPGNKKDAISYYRIAIDKGNDKAMFNYAEMLFNGDGIQVDKEEAFKLYKMAIDKGNSDAMYSYANALLKGDGIKQDVNEAIKYFRMAFKRGNSKVFDMMMKFQFMGFPGMMFQSLLFAEEK